MTRQVNFETQVFNIEVLDPAIPREYKGGCDITECHRCNNGLHVDSPPEKCPAELFFGQQKLRISVYRCNEIETN